MARPLRVAYENACYHVINRGNRRETIFHESDDCELFIEKLVEFATLYDVIIHSYCLMPNHFHLQVCTRHPNISKFMQSFLTSFTIIMNRKYLKSGHLFQGRFKAQLVESELYKNKLSRYIHLNPVKTKASEMLSTATLLSRLAEYKWSSFRYYIGLERKPKWLNRRFVLASWGKSAAEKMGNYRNYVEEGLKTDNSSDIQASLSGSIIGSEEFEKWVTNNYLKHDVSDIDSREQPILATVKAFSAAEVLKAVSVYYQVKAMEEITVRKGCHHRARKMAMFLAVKHCRRKETLSSLAAQFGVRISGLNMAADRFRTTLQTDASAKEDLKLMEKSLMGKCRKVEV